MTASTCVECGIKGKFIRLCPPCYLKHFTLLDSFKKIDLHLCALCGKLQEGNKWVKSGDLLKAKIARRVSSRAKLTPGVEDISIDVKTTIPDHTLNEGVNIVAEAIISVRGVPEDVGLPVFEEYEIPVPISYARCQPCRKEGTQYFEGVLQLRNPTYEAEHFIQARVQKEYGVSINNTELVKNGVDFYITSGKYLRTLAKQIHQRFGGEVKLSPQIYSKDRQTAKEIYRIMALCRLPLFAAKDIVDIEGSIVVISSVGGQKLTGLNIGKGKRIQVNYLGKQIHVLKSEMTQVSRIHPAVEVLDPETYQSIPVENKPSMDLEQGDSVRIVKHEERLYLIE